MQFVSERIHGIYRLGLIHHRLEWQKRTGNWNTDSDMQVKINKNTEARETTRQKCFTWQESVIKYNGPLSIRARAKVTRRHTSSDQPLVFVCFAFRSSATNFLITANSNIYRSKIKFRSWLTYIRSLLCDLLSWASLMQRRNNQYQFLKMFTTNWFFVLSVYVCLTLTCKLYCPKYLPFVS